MPPIAQGLDWRPIAECPPELNYIIAFVPDNYWYSRQGDQHVVTDERVCCVSGPGKDGLWWHDHHEGGGPVTPTHFVRPTIPNGFPASPPPYGSKA